MGVSAFRKWAGRIDDDLSDWIRSRMRLTAQMYVGAGAPGIVPERVLPGCSSVPPRSRSCENIPIDGPGATGASSSPICGESPARPARSPNWSEITRIRGVAIFATRGTLCAWHGCHGRYEMMIGVQTFLVLGGCCFLFCFFCFFSFSFFFGVSFGFIGPFYANRIAAIVSERKPSTRSDEYLAASYSENTSNPDDKTTPLEYLRAARARLFFFCLLLEGSCYPPFDVNVRRGKWTPGE